MSLKDKYRRKVRNKPARRLKKKGIGTISSKGARKKYDEQVEGRISEKQMSFLKGRHC